MYPHIASCGRLINKPNYFAFITLPQHGNYSGQDFSYLQKTHDHFFIIQDVACVTYSTPHHLHKLQTSLLVFLMVSIEHTLLYNQNLWICFKNLSTPKILFFLKYSKILVSQMISIKFSFDVLLEVCKAFSLSKYHKFSP